MTNKFAVILCGSGYLDGTAIGEAVSTLIHLSAAGAQVQCFAPDGNQSDVMDTLGCKPLQESRNMLVEAARIARGAVEPIQKLEAQNFDGLIIPGGFGVAKSLCDFANAGANAVVRYGVDEKILSFHEQNKPIGAICIAPALVALSLKSQKLELTLGADSEASQEIEKLGHRHVVCQAHEYCVDTENKLITTPAYMYGDASLKDVYAGIGGVVKECMSGL